MSHDDDTLQTLTWKCPSSAAVGYDTGLTIDVYCVKYLGHLGEHLSFAGLMYDEHTTDFEVRWS